MFSSNPVGFNFQTCLLSGMLITTGNVKNIYFLVILDFDLGNPTGTRIPDPLFPHLVPPAIMVWICVWKYIFEPFIHILQHFVLQLSRSTNFCF
jgi:hypothetical protein